MSRKRPVHSGKVKSRRLARFFAYSAPPLSLSPSYRLSLSFSFAPSETVTESETETARFPWHQYRQHCFTDCHQKAPTHTYFRFIGVYLRSRFKQLVQRFKVQLYLSVRRVNKHFFSISFSLCNLSLFLPEQGGV